MKKAIVGVVTHPDPDLSAPYFVETLRGLTSVFEDRLRVNPSEPVKGWVLLGPGPEELDRARATGQPVVLVNGEDPVFPGVDLDNRAAAREVVRHLCVRGHRRLALINGKLEHANGRDRREGFFEGVREAGISVRPEWEENGRFSREEGRRAMARLMALPEPPTAVFAANDHMALGALESLRALEKKAAVAGFDDVPEAAEIGLTTVRQPLADMARQAGQWLKTWMDTGQPPRRGTARWPGQLVVRRSTE